MHRVAPLFDDEFDELDGLDEDDTVKRVEEPTATPLPATPPTRVRGKEEDAPIDDDE